ncbi:t-SNARE [Epithele typhae]|uniref:t-SNARE n=1 Tax=Epithele typhae TaxID=378194 RepID=UPI0020085BAE|nr:t-SNARE [Epithele typhae]KAH9946004.1 t-SNARE [Epithele typhae]
MQNDRMAAFRAGRQQQQQPHEMTDFTNGANSPQSPTGTNGNGAAPTMDNFYNQVTHIQDDLAAFNANVQKIQDLHARTLNQADESVRTRDTAVLDDLVGESRGLSNLIKDRIQKLSQFPAARPQDQQICRNQTNRLRTRFVEVLQNYQSVERDYRQKYKQRIERQFKIVKPDATPEEVVAVVDDPEGGSQIFSQALSSSSQYGMARMAYRETQDRHNDIKKIERTLEELAQMFNDMSVLVAQQDEAIEQINTTAQNVELDAREGGKQVDKAVEHARSARRKRWICFGIIIFVIAVLALVLGLYFGVGPGKPKSSK